MKVKKMVVVCRRLVNSGLVGSIQGFFVWNGVVRDGLWKRQGWRSRLFVLLERSYDSVYTVLYAMGV